MNGSKSTVCLDPGHGGHKPGAVSFDGLIEKDLALKMALMVKGQLGMVQSIRVIMTRTTDIHVANGDRASFANREKADLFVSIHCNSAESRQANGAEVLVYSASSRSVPIAKDVQKQLVSLGLRDRGIIPRPKLTVLESTKMPAILVETAFLSCDHGVDFRILRSESGLRHIAEKIAFGLLFAF